VSEGHPRDRDNTHQIQGSPGNVRAKDSVSPSRTYLDANDACLDLERRIEQLQLSLEREGTPAGANALITNA
jgi:hypothetical protein